MLNSKEDQDSRLCSTPSHVIGYISKNADTLQKMFTTQVDLVAIMQAIQKSEIPGKTADININNNETSKLSSLLHDDRLTIETTLFHIKNEIESHYRTLHANTWTP
jgi:hypothetical protein